MLSRCGHRARRQLVPLLFLVTIVNAEENRLLSEGTCYYAAGEVANSVYIPCGNDAFGVYACCMNGDVCLSSNACYNKEFGDTYIAGCTDSTYSDPRCGDKGANGDLQWASLVRCFVSNNTSTNDEEWAACYESNQPVVTKHDGDCVCTASAHTAVFTDNPVLTNIAVLPAATGESISFEPGHTPPSGLSPTAQATTSTDYSDLQSIFDSTSGVSSISLPTGRSGSSSSNSATTGSPGPAISSSTGKSDHNSLSTTTETGIGIGVGFGVLLVCAGFFLLYHRRLKQRYMLASPCEQDVISPSKNGSKTTWSTLIHGQRCQEEADPANLAAMRSPAWSGYKPELPAEDHTFRTQPRQPGASIMISDVSEVEGTMIVTTLSDSLGRQSPAFTTHGMEPSNYTRSRESWIQTNVSASIQDMHELPGSHI